MYNSLFRVLMFRRSFATSRPSLAGHNKWSKIKERKGANDHQKSLIYGKASKDIAIAVRMGGSADPNTNVQLAATLKRVKEQGVPKENIAKALDKARKAKDGSGDMMTYEVLAFNSVGLLIECMSENPNRTANSIREIMNRHESRLASVKFMFQRKGRVKIAITKSGTMDKEESLIETALNSGAEDFGLENETDLSDMKVYDLICPPEKLNALTECMTVQCAELDAKLLESGQIYSPIEPRQLDEETETKLASLVEDLEGFEDTLRVWTSLD